MADLSKKDRSGNTRLVGADNVSGAESNFVEVSDNQELWVMDILQNDGDSDSLSVTAGTPVELRVGVANLSERKIIVLQPLDGKLKWGHSATSQPFELFKKQYAIIEVGPNNPIWIDAVSGTVTYAIGEWS